MERIRFVATLQAGLPHMDRITAMAVWKSPSGAILYTGSEADGGMNAFSLAAGRAARFRDQIGASENRGTYGLSDLALAPDGDGMALVPAGRHDDRLALHRLGPEGDFSSVRILGGDPAVLGRLQTLVTLDVEGKCFLIASQWGRSGFNLYRIRDDLSIEHKRSFADTGTASAGLVTDIASVEFAGRSYFFTVSAEEHGVTAWWIGRYGNVKERGSLDASSGLWVSVPTAVETAIVNGTAYVIVGSAGSDSLTVLKMDAWGGLFVKQHLIDTRETRFGGVSALETFEIDGRAFLVAGGADDGLTLFEIAPGGRLLRLAVLEDEIDTRLANVSAIKAHVFGHEVQLFVTSSSEAGLSQFTIDMSGLGISRSGGAANNELAGTAADDLLFGNAGDDRLIGFEGNDILIDGAGVDTLTGGPGADRFVFYRDNRLDTVTDFTPGEDVLDLSDFDNLHSFDQLVLTQKDYGVLITYETERIQLMSEGVQLLVSALSPDDFLF